MASNKFWADSTLEPKRQHRWLLYILSTDPNSQIPAYVIKKVDKPRIEINETEHKFFGHSFFYPGHVTWQDVTVTMVDPIKPDTSNKLYKAIEAAGYRLPTQRVGDAPFSISKAKAIGATRGNWFKDFFIPPSAEDFSGLLYTLLGKGKKGDAQWKFFKENLFLSSI